MSHGAQAVNDKNQSVFKCAHVTLEQQSAEGSSVVVYWITLFDLDKLNFYTLKLLKKT